jgi:hypothetical protein
VDTNILEDDVVSLFEIQDAKKLVTQNHGKRRGDRSRSGSIGAIIGN